MAVVLAVLALLLVSSEPAVEVQKRPSAEDIRAARQVWQQLKAARGSAGSKVRVDNNMISGLTALARDASGLPRMDATVTQGVLRGRVSLPLRLGLWLNVSASSTGSHRGFPAYKLTVGRLTLPEAIGRALANLGRGLLRLRGATIPPLDDLIQTIDIQGSHVAARVKLPPKTGLVDEVIAAGGREVNAELVGRILCRIASAERFAPVEGLPELVRRTFAAQSEESVVEYNRASFVALSLAVVGKQAEGLMREGAELRNKCPYPAGALRLQGRTDLAMHWIFSAGLTSAFGGAAAENLGEWKELDDSLPDGSGFSFVDLAADRAGVRMAVSALNPETAAGTKKALSQATEDSLLPQALLHAPEGLDEDMFVERFGSLDQKQYREALSRVDAILAQQ